MNKGEKVVSGLMIILIIAFVSFSVLLFKSMGMAHNPVVQYVEKESETVEPPELAEIQLSRLEFYKSQARYYNLMSIDYEDNLRTRGLLNDE